MIDKLDGTALLLHGQVVTFSAYSKYAIRQRLLWMRLWKQDPNNPDVKVS